MEVYPVSKQCHQEILNQMNNSICKIINKDKIIEIGFFCLIKKENKDIPVIIINNHINDEYYKNEINIIINNENKTIELDDIIYTNEKEKISIIKLKDDKNYNFIKYIELDDILYEKESEMFYNKESIYIIQYNEIKDMLVSYGIIKEINDDNILYISNINLNNNISLIFNLSNNKLIGIHKNTKNL